MGEELAPPRRVISGWDEAGGSIFETDAPASVHVSPLRPGMRTYTVWATSAIPCPVDEPDQRAFVRAIMPPPGGSVLKIIDYPPEPAGDAERAQYLAELRDTARAAAPGQEPGVRRYPDGPHPGMHETDTVDYAIVLSGEIHALMDSGETLLRAGDVLIQRGTRHGWSNRSGAYCRVAFVLVEARRPA